MKRNTAIKTLIVILFIAGASLLLYPLVSDCYNQWRSDQLIASYQSDVAAQSEDQWSSEFAAADAYNKTLPGKGVPDAFAVHTPSEDNEYNALLNVNGDGMMGYLEIPKISVSLPIGHSTADSVIATMVGHLQGSALPVGGTSTHAVLSTHRGLPSATLFSDLDQLEIGDHFYIYVLNRSLAYEVDQILTVEPSDTEALNVEAGKDLVTLVTCTPYGVNTHRLLVRGHRIAYDKDAAEAEKAQGSQSLITFYVIMLTLGVVAVATLVFYLRRRERLRNSRLQLQSSRFSRQPQPMATHTKAPKHVGRRH